MVVEFNRRTYHSFKKAFFDIKGIIADRKQIKKLMRSDLIQKPFRERLMLAVTSVNKCRYCSFVHSKMAFSEGISLEEIRELRDGILNKCPEEELPALLYAQHWVDSEGNPEPEIYQRILNIYGKDKTKAIELTIRMINTANLIGNTLDFLIYKLIPPRHRVSRDPQKEQL